MHDAVKGVMESTGMLDKSATVAEACRKAGMKVMHAAITFAKDASDNPNKKLGILAGCADGALFTEVCPCVRRSNLASSAIPLRTIHAGPSCGL